MPIYNEADMIENTIEGLKEIDLIDEIVIVNDGSTDNTAQVIENLGVSIITMVKTKEKDML